MIRRPPRSTQGVSSAASDVYKRQKKDQYKAAENVLKNADNSVIGKKIKNNRSAKLTKSEGADGTIRAAYLVWQARTSIKRSDTDAKALAKSEIAFVMPDGTAKLIKAQYATYDNRSIDYKNQNKEEGVRQQYTFCLLYTSPSPRDGATSRMPSSA